MHETADCVLETKCEPQNQVLPKMIGNIFRMQMETYYLLSSLEDHITGKKMDPADFPEPTCFTQHVAYVEEMAKRNAEVACRLSSLV